MVADEVFSSVTLIPLTLALNSTMPFKRKLSLAAVFGLTLLNTIFSTLRFALNYPSRGLTWLSIWTAVETSIAIILACLASFRNLVVGKKRSQDGSSKAKYLSSNSSGPSGQYSHSRNFSLGGQYPSQTLRHTDSARPMRPRQESDEDDLGYNGSQPNVQRSLKDEEAYEFTILNPRPQREQYV